MSQLFLLPISKGRMVAEEDVNEGPLLHVARNVHLKDQQFGRVSEGSVEMYENVLSGKETSKFKGSPGMAYTTYLVKLGMVYWVYH